MPDFSRRKFLTTCAGASALAATAASMPVVSWNEIMLAADDHPLGANEKILVLVTLYGGNDGLNTVVPYQDSNYFAARPELAYAPEDVLRLDSDHGLNPGLAGMAKMFDDGSLAIVRGVGYPNSSRSHFQSMDIWQSASLDNSVTSGWIGRWLDARGGDSMRALHMGPVLPPALVGESSTAAAFVGDRVLSDGSVDLLGALSEPDSDDSPAMTMVRDSYRNAVHVNDKLAPMSSESGASEVEFDYTNLTSQLDVVAACIEAGLSTQVYSVALGGFDTHADEQGTQQSLLRELDKALTRFRSKLAKHGNAKNIVIMAYSEFGRRVEANASDGTDHGTAGPVFVLGDRVKGGFYGDDPSLTDLKDDDLKVTTDFRDVYNEILARGLRTDPEPVLGKKRKEIGFLKS